MKIQEFKAESVSVGLQKVREALGADAIVLSTKSSPDRDGVVITAALPNPTETLPVRKQREESISNTLSEMRSELAELKDALVAGNPESYASTTPGVADLDRRLRLNGVGPRLRRRIVEASSKRSVGAEILGAASDVISEIVPIWPARKLEKKPRVLALIGPTGAGKTTTLAKLAGRLVYEAKKQVALVTLDTYRIAAVEQIRAYADMLSVPLKVAFTPSDASKAIEEFQDRDIVLIDTAGRSPYDSARLRELAGFLNTGAEIETLLVLAATTAPDVADEIMDRFDLTPSSALVLTKLDETKRPGNLLELIVQRDISLAYFANGQEVPKDLERVTGEKLSKLVLSGPSLEAAPALEVSL